MRNRKLKYGAGIVAVVVAVWLWWFSSADQNHRQELASLVGELHGTMGSISPPIPFVGSQIAIAFRNIDFAEQDLRKLSEALKPCSRHYVSINFQNTNATIEQAEELRQAIPYGRVHFDNYRLDQAAPRIKNKE